MTTIGYGNYVPESVGGKLFCLVYMCFGIPYFAYLTTIVSENINNFLGRLEIRALGVSNLRSCSIIRQLYIVGGIFIIVILPSLFFAKVEGDILESYSFFGDISNQPLYQTIISLDG